MRSISRHRARGKPPRNSSHSPHREHHQAPTQTVILLPGASLMAIQPLAPGMTLVRCPGCGAMKVFTSGPAGEITHVAFIHDDDACPILLRIWEALRLCAGPVASVQ
jgi:hypothetical protein